jgi:hypothetical protein
VCIVRASTLRLIDNRLRSIPHLTSAIDRFAVRALLAALDADVEAARFDAETAAASAASAVNAAAAATAGAVASESNGASTTTATAAATTTTLTSISENATASNAMTTDEADADNEVSALGVIWALISVTVDGRQRRSRRCGDS